MTERIISLAKFDLFKFGKYFFPHYFKVNSSPFHKELARDLQDAILSGDPKKMARAAPRDHAKSVWFTFILPIWCAVYGHKNYIIIISNTSEQADSYLGNIRVEFEENTRLIEAFGYLEGSIWHATKLRLSSGAQISSLGSGKRLRGTRRRQDRPDLILFDDVENDENVRSPDQRKKLRDWFFEAALKAGDRTTHFFIVGTLLHPNSLLADVLKNPGFNSRKYRAVKQFSQSPRWLAWQNLFIDLSNSNREEKAKEYFEMHRVEMLKGTEVLWHEWESYYDLMVMRLSEGVAAFNKEKQNNPVDPDERLFFIEEDEPRHWFEWEDIKDKLDLFVIRGACDPSLGKEMNKGDYRAIIIGGRDEHGYIYILEADIKRQKPDDQITDILNYGNQYDIGLFGIESVAFQEFFKNTVRKAAKEKGMQNKLPIIGIEQGKNKELRIQTLQPLIKNFYIKFHKSQKTLIEQLNNYPTDDHDDGPDALEMLVRLLKKGTIKMPKAEKRSRVTRKRRGMSKEF